MATRNKRLARRNKRAASPGTRITVPTEDCTRHNFFADPTLTDRQRLCWALQTETRVRFAKLEGQGSVESTPSLLQSPYLIDVYPDFGTTKDDGKPAHRPMDPRFSENPLIARDWHLYQRKAIPPLRACRSVDESFESLSKIKRSRFKDAPSQQLNAKKSLPVPPNMLFFDIVLEAFMGYKLPVYNSKDPALPRAAVMGGAIVAALTGFRDEYVVNEFDSYRQACEGLFESGGDLPGEELSKALNDYESAKNELVNDLHDYFLYSEGEDSPFSLGDVDVFLQASPLTRVLTRKLKSCGLDDPVLDFVSSFLGGCGLVQGDLHRYASTVDRELSPKLENTGGFVYTTAKNGLSFMFARPHTDTEYDSYDISVPGVREAKWPRASQLIMLSSSADLLGALLDFDLSTVACAFDGNNVCIAPRAAHSLLTMTSAITPFCFAEERNRKRVSKYMERGFEPFLLDPHCNHLTQCNQVGTVIKHRPPFFRGRGWYASNRFRTGRAVYLARNAKWESQQLRSADEYKALARAQKEYIRANRAVDPGGVQLPYCCCFPHSRNSLCIDRPAGGRYYAYMIALFEKEKGHGIDFFSNYFQWTAEDRAGVEAVPVCARVACRRCRWIYALQLFIDKAPDSLKSDIDTFRGDLSFTFSSGSNGQFYPAFYSGGVFSSKLVRDNARTLVQAMEALRGQRIFEFGRYILKHGSPEGYLPRFVHGESVDKVFSESSKVCFAKASKSPIGLNPERFIGQCESCGKWLHGCEYRTKFCESCESRKVSAV